VEADVEAKLESEDAEAKERRFTVAPIGVMKRIRMYLVKRKTEIHTKIISEIFQVTVITSFPLLANASFSTAPPFSVKRKTQR
jgi:hypothetical protein